MPTVERQSGSIYIQELFAGSRDQCTLYGI